MARKAYYEVRDDKPLLAGDVVSYRRDNFYILGGTCGVGLAMIVGGSCLLEYTPDSGLFVFESVFQSL